jgi:hypothetical protein
LRPQERQIRHHVEYLGSVAAATGVMNTIPYPLLVMMPRTCQERVHLASLDSDPAGLVRLDIQRRGAPVLNEVSCAMKSAYLSFGELVEN